MTRRVWVRDSREAMNMALDIAEDSNCNSRHLGTVVVDVEGDLIASGFNFTADPVCLLGFCHKRREGQGTGHSNICHAIPALDPNLDTATIDSPSHNHQLAVSERDWPRC